MTETLRKIFTPPSPRVEDIREDEVIAALSHTLWRSVHGVLEGVWERRKQEGRLIHDPGDFLVRTETAELLGRMTHRGVTQGKRVSEMSDVERQWCQLAKNGDDERYAQSRAANGMSEMTFYRLNPNGGRSLKSGINEVFGEILPTR